MSLGKSLRADCGLPTKSVLRHSASDCKKRYDEAFECYMKAWRAGNSQGRIGAENVGHIFSNAGDTEKAEALYARIRDKK